MSPTAQSTVSHVTSVDGTRIAVFVTGAGRPLVFLHGTTSDHESIRFAASYLEPHLQVHAVDRRGRGASGDGAEYSVELEHADAAAVIDAAAAGHGGPVDVLGHSYGGNVAFGAALRTRNIRRLALYEGWPVPNVTHRRQPPELLRRLDELLAEGQPELMLETMLRGIAKLSDDEIAAVKAAPTWPSRLAAAPTVPREVRAFGAQAFDPEEAARIEVPVLLLIGGDSPPDVKADPEVVAAALPDARIHVLDGQMHVAHLLDPETFAGAVLEFLRD